MITLDTPGLSLEFSPNLAAATPLPAALRLFASGLGAMGCSAGAGSGRTLLHSLPPDQNIDRISVRLPRQAVVLFRIKS